MGRAQHDWNAFALKHDLSDISCCQSTVFDSLCRGRSRSNELIQKDFFSTRQPERGKFHSPTVYSACVWWQYEVRYSIRSIVAVPIARRQIRWKRLDCVAQRSVTNSQRTIWRKLQSNFQRSSIRFGWVFRTKTIEMRFTKSISKNKYTRIEDLNKCDDSKKQKQKYSRLNQDENLVFDAEALMKTSNAGNLAWWNIEM